jgi:hypothetical protein
MEFVMIHGARRVEIADVEVLNDTNLVLYCRVGDEVVGVPSLQVLPVLRSSTGATGGDSCFRTTSLWSSVSSSYELCGAGDRGEARACRGHGGEAATHEGVNAGRAHEVSGTVLRCPGSVRTEGRRKCRTMATGLILEGGYATTLGQPRVRCR